MATSEPAGSGSGGRRVRGAGRRRQADLDRRRRTLLLVAVSVVAVVMLGALANTIAAGQASGRRSLEDRAVQRNVIAARAVAATVEDRRTDVEAHAEVALSGPAPTSDDLERLARMLRVRSAALLDDEGVPLAVATGDRALGGVDQVLAEEALRQAREGGSTVSGAVVETGDEGPAVVLAVPFDTPEGRRVLGVAYDVDDTALGAYLRDATVLPGEVAHLVDGSGAVIATSDAAAPPLDPALAGLPDGESLVDGGTSFVTVRSIDGTSWRLVRVLPTGAMYAPADEGRWIPWALVVGFVLVGAASLVMLGSILDQRDRERRRAALDPLTGLANRRSLDASLADRTAAPAPEPWAVLMVDVDHFKAVNDRHGHRRGDEVLVAVADALAGGVRARDLVGRWGGEEFMVVADAAPLPVALALAERLRGAVAAVEVDGVGVTVSIGVASSSDSPADGLVDLADASLYRAKQDGRDRCVSLTVAEAFPALTLEPR